VNVLHAHVAILQLKDQVPVLFVCLVLSRQAVQLVKHVLGTASPATMEHVNVNFVQPEHKSTLVKTVVLVVLLVNSLVKVKCVNFVHLAPSLQLLVHLNVHHVLAVILQFKVHKLVQFV